MNEFDYDEGLIDEIDRIKGFEEDLGEDWHFTIARKYPKKKCECGAHSIKCDKHSDYCPLYTKD